MGRKAAHPPVFLAALRSSMVLYAPLGWHDAAMCTWDRAMQLNMTVCKETVRQAAWELGKEWQAQ
jgi:hypothetical protein